jgi:hypothetical protein
MTVEFENALQSAARCLIKLHDSADGMQVSELVSTFRVVMFQAQEIIDELQRIPAPHVDRYEIPGRYLYEAVEG